MTDNSAAQPTNDKANTHQSNTDNNPSVAPATPPKESHNDSGNSKRSANKPNRDFFDIANLIVLVLAFLAAVAAACDGSTPDIVTIDVQNGGQTPAYNVKIRSQWQPMPLGEKLPKTFPYAVDLAEDLGTGGSLLPGEKEPGITDIKDPKVKSWIADARADKVSVYYFGQIEYMDVFKRPRITPFCAGYDPHAPEAESFVGCPEHNTPNDND